MADKDYIETLIERDKAMPMGRYYYQSKAFKDDPPEDTCPLCGYIVNGYNFCPMCGQRLDKENYKL